MFRPIHHLPALTLPVRFAVALLAALALIVGFVAVDAADPAAAAGGRVIFVATDGNDGAAGTATAPYRTIGRAVSAASSGDTVVVGGGVYRETITIYGKAVTITSAPGERVVLEGARPVTGFAASGGDWYAGWTHEFQVNTGPMVLPGNPAAGHPDQVFVDGTPQRQVLSRNEVVPGTFYHDRAADRLWIGTDPSGKLVEASDLSFALYLNKAHGSRLTDFTVRRYGTEGRHMAAIRAYSDNIVVDGVKSELNAYSGFSAIGNGIVVRDSTFKDNGYIGLHGHKVTTLVVERVSIFGNNKAGFDPFHSAAGMKVTNTTGLTVRDSDVSRNDGPGIWTDLSVQYVSLVRNLTEYNGRSGIEIELSSDVNAVGNVSIGNGETGIWVLESQNVQVFHNALYGNRRDIWVEEGPRAEVQNVWIRNNVFGLGRDRSPALFNVDDWTAERSADDMNVTSDYNAFWLPESSPTRHLSRWARWPQGLAFASTLAEHQQLTGQDANSMWSTAPTNPYVRDAAAADYRLPVGTTLGVPVRASMAWQLGVPSGTRLPIGPVAPVVDR